MTGSRRSALSKAHCETMYRGVLAACACAMLWRGPSASAAGLRPECPPSEGARCEEGEFSALGESFYKVDGRNVYINYMVGSNFEMHCDSVNHSIEHPALPRFTELVRVRRIQLRSCAPPAKPYAHVLAALNVSVADKLVLDELPAAPPLRDDHFEGLHSLVHLELSGLQTDAALLPPHILRPLSALQKLMLTHVQPGVALELLLTSLHSLRLWFTGIKLVTLAGISRLQQLSVRETSTTFVNVTGATNLVSLALSSPNSSAVGVTSLDSLNTLRIDYWSETRPQPWIECSALEQLNLMDSVSRQQTLLPDWWIAHCPVLSELSMRRIPLAPLPMRLLGNTTTLKTLRLSGCNLTELPKDLFSDSVQLTLLDLSYNRLETLSRDLFFSLRALKTLNLSNNLLTTTAAQALQPLSSLRELFLEDNTQLSDLCEGRTETVITKAGPSPLQLMTDLTWLVLRNTSISRICQDWRESMPKLKNLDLTETRVTVLEYEDVLQRRSISGAKMKVGGKNYTIRFEYFLEDYERAESESATPGDLTIDISATVDCDCSAYWAALCFRKGARHSRVAAPRCTAGGHTLRNVSLDQLTCAAPALCTNLTGCTCVSREDANRSGGVATARCEHRHLTGVPGPLPPGPVWRMQLAHNDIATLHVADLPSQLVELDLRNNSLEKLDRDVVTELFKRRVRLANNPLRCDCDGFALLREIAANPGRVDGLNVTCRGGVAPPSVARLADECEPNGSGGTSVSATVLVVLLAVVAAVAVVVLTVLTRPEMRLRLKAFLDTLEWLPGRRGEADAAEEAEKARQFDAFVSYAHEDEAWVRAALVSRLERAGYAVCVHYRDWAPGEWIPAQIAASVRASRRTLAVVSKHFVQSDWARLEFREAHAHARRDVTPRLVVLLLEDPALLPLDAEMRGFVQNNTYVRWDDPWFWRKLQRAMPPLRRKEEPKECPPK